MKRRFILHVLIAALLLPALILQGCLMPDVTAESPPETSRPTVSPPNQSNDPIRVEPSDGRFTLRYNPNSTMNPITSLDKDNILLAALMYEGLFTLDSSLNVEPVLCESWSTEDSITYTFEIRSDVYMRDGSMLTAEDVAYSLRQAMLKGRYVNWLKNIHSISTEDEHTVIVTLNSPNSRFIYLLDIPIIKNGSIDDEIPPGTGPYVFYRAVGIQLVRFLMHRDYEELPVTVIWLVSCTDNEQTEYFDGGVLSLLRDDPSGAFEIRLNRLKEPRYYDTTTLQFIGFNARSVVMHDLDVRRAIGCSIDRQYIVSNIMPGQTLAAPIALSPAYLLYDPHWADLGQDPLREMSMLFVRAGLKDFDNDSYLEYPDGFGGYYKFSSDFIVNSENAYKVKAAHKIAETLRLAGFDITVRELPWDSFLQALQTGNFDMYYGEIVLSADFDLSPLLLPESSLNYGLTGRSDYRQYVIDFLSASTPAEEAEAARNLCDEITQNAPFVPILYKRYAIYTPLGAVTGAAPSQSNVFYNFTDWVIDFSMLS